MSKPAFFSPRSPTITFWGAARTVTGSMHHVEVGDERILLDCGRPRTKRKRPRSAKVVFPFKPATIDAVVLSHAHVDHCGNLPALVSQGFSGPIYCTPATRELIAIMLTDSARFDDEQAVLQAAGIGQKKHATSASRSSPVQQALSQCVTVPLDRAVTISPNCQLEFFEAGHVLGSAMSRLTFDTPTGEVTVAYTGDLGRRSLPYLLPPAPIPEADLLICESTYGGRHHQSLDAIAERFDAAVRRTVADQGIVLIPAFSLGRTQVVAHYVEKWMAESSLPKLPIVIDSPMAADIAEVHDRYPQAFVNGHGRQAASNGTSGYVRSRETSDELSERTEPYVLIASGGTCDGGRVMKHLRRHIDDPRASLLLVSYQPPGSLGHQLLQPQPTAFFHGRNWNKWIAVHEMNGFSGHAGHQDFLDCLKPLLGRTSQICLVHGEPEQAEALSHGLERVGFRDVRIPALGDAVAVE